MGKWRGDEKLYEGLVEKIRSKKSLHDLPWMEWIYYNRARRDVAH